MFRVGLVILALLPGLAQADTRGRISCEAHGECGDLAVCWQNKCQLAVGRVYTVTVVGGEIAERKANGRTWDASPKIARSGVAA